ncbi:MAG: HNH endonuclease [Sphingomonadales bacterium]|nr:MAG: HNH endonuclease [Sphingomonadales bacterium]
MTDKDWYDYLSHQPEIEEVNFWQPSGRTKFRALRPGELFLFKLHSPNNFIVGGGIFAHASLAPTSLAWEAFGESNGASSLRQMRERVARYRREPFDPRADPQIGCRLLEQPFFFPPEDWIPVPESWAPSIVVGKGFDTDEPEGRGLWDAIQIRLAARQLSTSDEIVRFGPPRLVAPRLGQGTFRIAVTDTYERRCAVTGEKTLPILDAAHIRAFSDGGSHNLGSGLID